MGEWIDPNGGFGGEKIRSIYKKKNQFFERKYMFDTSVNKGVEMSARLLKINNGKYKYADSDENLYFWVNQAGNLEYSVGSGETYIAKKSTN